MRTLYIDVYFLINFTIDLISVYFASVISLVPATQKRLVLSAFIGSALSIATVFLVEIWFVGIIATILYVGVLAVLLTKGVGAFRKIKFIASFFIVEFILGGFIQFLYGVLDKYVLARFEDFSQSVGNRRLLLLALIVLLSVGTLRIVTSLFYSRRVGGAVSVDISFEGRRVSLEAFCDSGNLAKDPLDLSPVIIVKRTAIEPLFSHNFPLDSNSYENFESLDYSVRKKIRMIPVNKASGVGMMIGIKPDSIFIAEKDKDRKTQIRATVAIDNEGGTYGGYYGLIPTAAINDALV